MEQGLGKHSPGAYISVEPPKYNVTYYVPVQEAVKALDVHTIPPPKSPRKRKEEDKEDESSHLLLDHRELSLPSSTIDFSPEALSFLDNNRYDISYYIKLSQEYKGKSIEDNETLQKTPEPSVFHSRETSDLSAGALSEMDGKKYKMSYYLELEKYNKQVRDYEDKLLRYKAGDKEVFQDKPDPFIFYSKDYSDLSAGALSELDGKKFKMSYYVELEKYNKETREYEEKLLRYKAGDKDAFASDPLLFYSKDTADFTGTALSEMDGKKYKLSYYEKLREYQKEREEYERKMLLYKLGHKDIFEKKEEPPPVIDEYSLSAQALGYLDGNKYKRSYYEELQKYHEDIQAHNKKLILHNSGYKSDDKPDPLIFYSKDKSDMSATALSEMDGKKYKMSYYVKLKDYYKEVEEFELKKLLHETDGKKDEILFPQDIVNTGFQETDKIWTPEFSDMVSSVKGKVAPYFIDNLFQTMKSVDGEFEDKFASPLLRLHLYCSTDIVPESEMEIYR